MSCAKAAENKWLEEVLWSTSAIHNHQKLDVCFLLSCSHTVSARRIWRMCCIVFCHGSHILWSVYSHQGAEIANKAYSRVWKTCILENAEWCDCFCPGCLDRMWVCFIFCFDWYSLQLFCSCNLDSGWVCFIPALTDAHSSCSALATLTVCESVSFLPWPMLTPAITAGVSKFRCFYILFQMYILISSLKLHLNSDKILNFITFKIYY